MIPRFECIGWSVCPESLDLNRMAGQRSRRKSEAEKLASRPKTCASWQLWTGLTTSSGNFLRPIGFAANWLDCCGQPNRLCSRQHRDHVSHRWCRIADQQFRADVQAIMYVAVALGEKQATITSHSCHEDLALGRARFVRQHPAIGATRRVIFRFGIRVGAAQLPGRHHARIRHGGQSVHLDVVLCPAATVDRARVRPMTAAFAVPYAARLPIPRAPVEVVRMSAIAAAPCGASRLGRQELPITCTSRCRPRLESSISGNSSVL